MAAGSLMSVIAAAACAQQREPIIEPVIRNGVIAESLTGTTGDAARGRDVARDPSKGNCLICHSVPDAANERFQGDIGPPLAGVGARLAGGQLRLRIVDSTQLNAQTVMPTYHRLTGLRRVARQWRGSPVLSAAEVEDVVAYLLSLSTPP